MLKLKIFLTNTEKTISGDNKYNIKPYAIYFPQFHRFKENDKLFYPDYNDIINLYDIFGKVKVVFGFMPTSGKSGLPTDVIDLKSRIPSWTHDEIFFIGLPPDTDKKISRIWYQLLEEWLNDKETEEVFKKAYFGKDVKNADQIVSVIKHQGTMIKKFNVDIK